MHRERVERHCRGVTTSLNEFKARFQQMVEEHDKEVGQDVLKQSCQLSSNITFQLCHEIALTLMNDSTLIFRLRFSNNLFKNLRRHSLQRLKRTSKFFSLFHFVTCAWNVISSGNSLYPKS